MRGLIVDWGGVLTMPIHTAIGSWLKVTGVDREHYGAVLGRWVQPTPDMMSPVHRLERGETMLADLSIYEDSMTSLVTRAHAAGIRTALLSNSWGHDYDRSDWHEMFDAVVISGEVGMRKPEREIFELTLDRIGLPAGECVFIDDIPHNVAAAAEAGLVGIVHRTFDETAGELEALFPGAGWIHQRLR